MKKKLIPSLSTSLVGLFFFLLLFLGIFAETFESRTPEIDLAQIYANPTPIAELQRLHKLVLTNKYGSFEMINAHPEDELIGPWQLISPQTQRIKSDIIPKIVENLNILRVRSIHRYEPINVTSFSLDNPNLSLFFTTNKNKDYEIKLGLINPIDNSAYLSISSQDQIYQIDPLEMALETYDLSQMVEARVLAINYRALKSIEIIEKEKNKFLINQVDKEWFNQEEEELSGEKVQNFLSQVDEMKSSSILENLSSDQLQNFREIVQAHPIELKLTFEDHVRSYFFSEVKKNLLGLGQQFNGQYLFTNEEMKTFSVIKKDQLKFLQATTRSLK